MGTGCPETGHCLRIPAGKQGDVMTLANEFFRHIRDDSFRAPVQLGWDAFPKRGDLCDFHVGLSFLVGKDFSDGSRAKMSAVNAPITLLAPPSPSISIVTRLPKESCRNNCGFVMSNIIAAQRSPPDRTTDPRKDTSDG